MTAFTATGHLSSGCPAQTGEKESVSSSFSALKGEKKNLDYPTKRTQLPLRRGWGMHAAACVGLSPVFHLLQRQRPMHTHGCSVYRRQQTPRGPEVPSPVCLCWQMWQLDQTELELLGHLLQQGPRKAFPLSLMLPAF